MMPNYWELRSMAAKIVPRVSKLPGRDGYAMKEKGRKSNYNQFNIQSGEMDKMERLLNMDSMGSFAEVSLRAQSCPMPFNVDVWDGLSCPYKCKYCFADYFRHSLYTSFFDNGKQMGLRNCAEEFWKGELDKLLPHRGEKVEGENTVINAVRMNIPIRLGIRFEDFAPAERKKGVSLRLLQYLSEAKYPVMINTKSDLLGQDEYTQALSGNVAGSAVHITMISSNEEFLRKMEPGAPSFKRRLAAAKILTDNGVRVVARIEPWMMFLNDDKAMVDDYIAQMKAAGVKHLTFDSYSYSAYSKGLAENFYSQDLDFERMFSLSADSQWLQSLFLGAFIKYFQEHGFSSSTFDQGNVPDNDDWICCSVGDYFTEKGAGFNWGSGVIAVKFIQSKAGQSVGWKDFEDFVVSKGGWLSNQLRREVMLLWQCEGDAAWPIHHARGLVSAGQDEYGLRWKYKDEDFREHLWSKGGLI